MPEGAFPKPVAEVVQTLTDLFRHQTRREIAEVLENAHARFDQIEFDNWNGGTYTWMLRLEVPVSIYASIEPRLQEVEKEIDTALQKLVRQYPNDQVAGITVTPIAEGSSPLGQRMAPSDYEARRIWGEGRLRLFLSHLSKYKREVSSLKTELACRGIAAFVAHEDIEPSLQWQKEIESALRSMHALAALVTPDFHDSKWTDQEVGWAFGRGIPVFPVRLGTDPYGFAGAVQGVAGALERPGALADVLVEALLLNSQTSGEMRRALLSAFRRSDCFITSRTLCPLVTEISDFTEEEKRLLWNACEENDQIGDAFGVVKAINAKIGGPPAPKPKKIISEIPF